MFTPLSILTGKAFPEFTAVFKENNSDSNDGSELGDVRSDFLGMTSEFKPVEVEVEVAFSVPFESERSNPVRNISFFSSMAAKLSISSLGSDLVTDSALLTFTTEDPSISEVAFGTSSIEAKNIPFTNSSFTSSTSSAAP